MNFLCAKEIRMVRYESKKKLVIPVCSISKYEQQFYVKLSSDETGTMATEMVALFDEKNECPSVISLSINQYTMEPLDIEILMYKYRAKKPYENVKVEDLRTFVRPDEGTNRIVFRFTDPQNKPRSLEVKVGANYIEF